MIPIESAVAYILKVGMVTAVQLFTLGGPGLILIYLLSKLSGYVQRLAGAAFGPSLYLLLFGWLGTTIHETGHLIVAMIFGHTVTSYRPFAPDRKTGTLGSVETTFNPGNLYQYIGLFFIGIAPVVFGTLVIFVALYLLFREQLSDVSARMAIDASTVGSIPSQIITASLAFLSFLFRPDHLADWRLYVFLYIAFVIGSSISLSNADVKVATPGCTTFIALLFLFNLVLVSIGVTSENTFAWLSQTYAFFYVILFLVIVLDLLAVAILWIPAAIRRS